MRNLVWLVVLGCSSSSSPPGEPLVSGSVAAAYAGNAFTPGYGFATMYMNSGLIGFAEAKVHCGSETSATPPSGSGVIVQIPSIAVGSYTNAFVQVYADVGGFMSTGSTGTVDVTAVGSTVAGTIAFSFTDPDNGKVFSANGTFEIINCMP